VKAPGSATSIPAEERSKAVVLAMRAGLAAAEAHLTTLTDLRCRVSLDHVDDSTACVGVALGGAIHHLKSAIGLLEQGRTLSAQVLSRSALECIDAIWCFVHSTDRAREWRSADPPRQLHHDKSRHAMVQGRSSDAAEQSTFLATAYYGTLSDYAHPTWKRLLDTYTERDGVVLFDELSLHDTKPCRLAVNTCLSLVGHAATLAFLVFGDDAAQRCMNEARRDSGIMSAALGFPRQAKQAELFALLEPELRRRFRVRGAAKREAKRKR
jgi:hypothetical protein